MAGYHITAINKKDNQDNNDVTMVAPCDVKYLKSACDSSVLCKDVSKIATVEITETKKNPIIQRDCNKFCVKSNR